jgi:hypothetical protein
MKWTSFFADRWDNYKVTNDSHLALSSKKLFSMFEDQNLLVDTFPNIPNLKSFRRDYKGQWKNLVKYPELYSYFKQNFIDYLEAEEVGKQMKVEELSFVSNEVIDQHNVVSRMKGVIPSQPNRNLPDNSYWITAAWHADRGQPLNNLKLLIYVDDVEQGMGEFVISEPPQNISTVKAGDGSMLAYHRYKTENTSIYSDQIPSKHIIGPSGTVIGFNSHILHRANVPHFGKRRCIHLSIESPFSHHFAPEYEI